MTRQVVARVRSRGRRECRPQPGTSRSSRSSRSLVAATCTAPRRPKANAWSAAPLSTERTRSSDLLLTAASRTALGSEQRSVPRSPASPAASSRRTARPFPRRWGRPQCGRSLEVGALRCGQRPPAGRDRSAGFGPGSNDEQTRYACRMFVQCLSKERASRVQEAPSLGSRNPETGTRASGLLPAFVFVLSAGADRR